MKYDIKETAKKIGFAKVGVTTAEPVNFITQLNNAVAAGYVSSMEWLARNPKDRCDPCSILPNAKSVICCALSYDENGIVGARRAVPLPKYHIARFARGADYHKAVLQKLKLLWNEIVKYEPTAHAEFCVDSRPILEKALAERSGIGWIGKHTILVNKEIGSWFVLGEIITDLELKPDTPARNQCGNCTACIESCPTDALVAPYTLDARKCISFLTIKNKKEGPYGCDLCQEACPYNRI